MGDACCLTCAPKPLKSANASRPDSRCRKCRKAAGEESPGSMETRCRVTPGEGNLRESATESKPPQLGRKTFSGVRVKGWSKSPPRHW
ncbi:hypothetical protein LP7551_01581 [Roseibium album]|nr:hypothetical protein LP7551_01581 [Roseibium album]